MSLRRTMKRGLRPEARLAQRIGDAIAEYGRAGGTLPVTTTRLLRYAAQCFLMSGTPSASAFRHDFVRQATEAFDQELTAIIEKAEKTGKA